MSQGGFIYMIGAEGTNHVKIGSTRGSVQQRLRALQVGHPYRLFILAAARVERDLIRIERQIHAWLKTERQHGEWFSLSVDSLVFEHLVRQAELLSGKEGEAKEAANPLEYEFALRSFGERVARRRRKYGWTQEVLADRAQVVPEMLHAIEQGIEASPPLDVAMRITKALGETMDYMTGLMAEMERGLYRLTYGKSPA
jgi:DNA-binding XRE family transcriptional regulator